MRTFTQDGLSILGLKPPFPPMTNTQFPSKFTYSAYEYANVLEVNGPVKQSGEGFDLDKPTCLRAMNWQVDTTRKKMVIAPCWKPNGLAQPFWVLDVGVRSRDSEPSPIGAAADTAGWFAQTRHPGMPEIPQMPKDNVYEWAIVIGGQPDVSFEDGCTVREAHTDHSGLWLMTRQPVPEQAFSAPKPRCKPERLSSARSDSSHTLHQTEPHLFESACANLFYAGSRRCVVPNEPCCRLCAQRLMDEMYSSLEAKGIARSRLHSVAHSNCQYAGANLCHNGRCRCRCLHWGPKPLTGVFDISCAQRECVETGVKQRESSSLPENVTTITQP